ncbi:MAG: 2Fe-2S ferredoxin, partial [Candidatus Bathyarchaeota archaeon]
MHNLYLEKIETPAFIWDEVSFWKNMKHIVRLGIGGHVNLVYPLKPFSILNCLKNFMSNLSGFSTSSVFEARLAREIIGNGGSVHFTSPCLREDEVDEVISLIDYISFNSMAQWERFRDLAIAKLSCALRVNPQLSFIKNNKYDPCRKHSKLGVPLRQLSAILSNGSNILEGIKGIHFHTNCESTNFDHLLRTVKHIDTHIP